MEVEDQQARQDLQAEVAEEVLAQLDPLGQQGPPDQQVQLKQVRRDTQAQQGHVVVLLALLESQGLQGQWVQQE